MKFDRIVLCITLSLSMCNEASAQSSPDDVLTDEKLSKLTDWIIEINVNDLDRYLNHSGTKLSPMSKVIVSYRLLPRPGKMRSTEQVDYEEIYYSGITPVGTRKLNELALPNGEVGVIRVLQTPHLSEVPITTANAIVRTYLDVALKNNRVMQVLCPAGDIAAIQQSLPSQNFFPTDKPAPVGAKKTSMILSFRSEPKSKDTTRSFAFFK